METSGYLSGVIRALVYLSEERKSCVSSGFHYKHDILEKMKQLELSKGGDWAKKKLNVYLNARIKLTNVEMYPQLNKQNTHFLFNQ